MSAFKRLALPLAAAGGISALTLGACRSDLVTCGAWCPHCGLDNQYYSTATTSVTFQGTPFDVAGNVPTVGGTCPDFTLVGGDLSEVNLSKYEGKRKILNIFPSIDTGVCATSVEKFNAQVTELENAVCLCISQDLPFAQGRFAEDKGIKDVEFLSGFRSKFGEQYGVKLVSGPLAGLTARAVVAVDCDGTVVHTELVSELTNEPNYEAALAHFRKKKCCNSTKKKKSACSSSK